jgi:hypothetical protein
MLPSLQLEFEFEADLSTAISLGATPDGLRRVIPILGGRVRGPRISGEVLPGGADWQRVREDGVTVPEARYLLRTDDAVTIQVDNVGLRHGPEDVMRRLAAGERVDPAEYYFRSTPRFAVAAGKYDWLNRSIFVCAGARYPESIRLWFYRVT